MSGIPLTSRFRTCCPWSGMSVLDAHLDPPRRRHRAPPGVLLDSYPAGYSRRGDPQFYEADLRALAAGRPIRDEHRERVTAPVDTTR